MAQPVGHRSGSRPLPRRAAVRGCWRLPAHLSMGHSTESLSTNPLKSIKTGHSEVEKSTCEHHTLGKQLGEEYVHTSFCVPEIWSAWKRDSVSRLKMRSENEGTLAMTRIHPASYKQGAARKHPVESRAS